MAEEVQEEWWSWPNLSINDSYDDSQPTYLTTLPTELIVKIIDNILPEYSFVPPIASVSKKMARIVIWRRLTIGTLHLAGYDPIAFFKKHLPILDRNYGPFENKSAIELIRSISLHYQSEKLELINFAKDMPNLSTLDLYLRIDIHRYRPTDPSFELEGLHDLPALKLLNVNLDVDKVYRTGCCMRRCMDIVQATEVWVAKGFEDRGQKVKIVYRGCFTAAGLTFFDCYEELYKDRGFKWNEELGVYESFRIIKPKWDKETELIRIDEWDEESQLYRYITDLAVQRANDGEDVTRRPYIWV